ncbi:glycosyl hydrolase [Nonomuraea jiangxiensis]|uniref:F5/8 type C domain-containing protein n=1 Tax=Nonomuraea jiangxiensis TaxID=633440 RepID=A0A1G9IRC5_9ACTN|nr:glycosyl hydrolase [Nonomuraea jiangxiensis]SDL27692.1 F5/8 type C domain-containing protein [Nonomuraea jiangxiensis]
MINGTPAGAAELPLSQHRPALASSAENGGLPATNAVDGKANTRWSSKFSDPQWLQVDLGKTTKIKKVVINWERSYARAFKIQTSNNGLRWNNVYSTTAGRGGEQTIQVSGNARYVRLYATKRSTQYGVSVWEFQVFGKGGTTPLPTASPQPTPTRTQPTGSPQQPTPTPTKPVDPPAAPSGKKGVGVWQMPNVSTALAKSGAHWYYTWSTNHNGITTPKSSEFVPMIWGANSVTDSNLAQAKSAGSYLLGFNEPDMAEQSNMTVDKALSLWPKLMSTGQKLGSPAVAWGGDRAGGWLDKFMKGAEQKNYRVDFVTLHWYGGDFRTEAAVGQLKSYLQAVYDRYKKPIWLTEYALIDFSQGARFPSEAQQAAFVTASTKMLESLTFVHRFAWFGLPAEDGKQGTGLFRSNGDATPAGRAFQEAR